MSSGRYYDVRQSSQPLDGFVCLVKSSHVCATRREKAVARDPVRLLLQRLTQRRSGFLKSPGKEMGHADPHERVCSPFARVEAQRSLEMLDREIGLPGPQPEPP